MTHDEPVADLRVITGADAEPALSDALVDPEVTALLVHDGVELAPGALARLRAELASPGRRLVRVLVDGARCLLVEADLVRESVGSGLDVAALARADLDVDHVLAAGPDDGLWRHWVDGAVVGLRSADGADAVGDWRRSQARRHGRLARARAAARGSAGRARRAVSRHRDRRGAQPR